MASNLGCVGLGVSSEDEMADLINRVMPLAEPIGQAAGITLYRWQDPSGARLLLGIDRDDDVTEMLPSFDAAVGARLGSVEFVSDEVASAAVLDEDGEQVTAFTVELEERLLLRAAGVPLDGPAAITALGVDVEVFASAEAFSESDASTLSPDDTDSAPPPHYAERGWKWPPRVAPSSSSRTARSPRRRTPTPTLGSGALSCTRASVAWS